MPTIETILSVSSVLAVTVGIVGVILTLFQRRRLDRELLAKRDELLVKETKVVEALEKMTASRDLLLAKAQVFDKIETRLGAITSIPGQDASELKQSLQEIEMGFQDIRREMQNFRQSLASDEVSAPSLRQTYDKVIGFADRSLVVYDEIYAKVRTLIAIVEAKSN